MTDQAVIELTPEAAQRFMAIWDSGKQPVVKFNNEFLYPRFAEFEEEENKYMFLYTTFQRELSLLILTDTCGVDMSYYLNMSEPVV